MSHEDVNPRSTLSVSILSGKGGVGKTNLALNLAYALYKASHKMLVMDFDVGLANVDVLLGVSPEKNLQDLLKPGVMPADVVAEVEPGGFDFLPAASGVPELLELDEDMRDSVFTKLNTVLGEYDYVLFDLGAGIGKTVLALASMTRMRVLVVTPEPTSLTDGYAVVKVLKNQHNIKDFQVVVNQASSAKEAQLTFDRLHGACKRFLDLDIGYLGAVHTDPNVPEAVRRQVPLIKYAPQCRASQDILSLAIKIARHRAESKSHLKAKAILKKITHG
ncbi:MinD/ParA family protein [Fundidesulfovibrio terrae]|uniref:MinD/ParA family protein n=1 Tax=Fundidesulfovibrio terrae TaxID=2922866 RepID=UPI001FAFFFB6|nr:MinD/ParA family protein [Fundidesulfovibrio terrae]